MKIRISPKGVQLLRNHLIECLRDPQQRLEMRRAFEISGLDLVDFLLDGGIPSPTCQKPFGVGGSIHEGIEAALADLHTLVGSVVVGIDGEEGGKA